MASTQSQREFPELPPLRLEEREHPRHGARLGPITLAYETCGKLNSDKNNAVLVLHALSGDSHVAGYYSEDDPKPGWWDIMVGPGKGIDTNCSGSERMKKPGQEERRPKG